MRVYRCDRCRAGFSRTPDRNKRVRWVNSRPEDVYKTRFLWVYESVYPGGVHKRQADLCPDCLVSLGEWWERPLKQEGSTDE